MSSKRILPVQSKQEFITAGLVPENKDTCISLILLLLLLLHDTRLTALFLGLPGWAGTRKVNPIWILLKQETVSGSGISWAICKSATRSRQITMPAPHHSSFLQARCPSCHPTNSVKALKAKNKDTCVSLIIEIKTVKWKKCSTSESQWLKTDTDMIC